MLLKNRYFFPSDEFCNFYDSAGSVLDSQHYIHPWNFFGERSDKSVFWRRFHIVVLGMTFFFLFFIRSFTFHILFGLLFPFSIWTFISLFYLDFYFPFLFGLLFPFSLWTFISLFYLNFYFPFLFGLLFPFSIWKFYCWKKYVENFFFTN